jgi:hypothetical protein
VNSSDHAHPEATSRSESVIAIEGTTDTDIAPEKGAGFLKNLYDYQGGTFMPSVDDQSASPPNAQLNTLFGVYLPCVQNIIGIIVFIRLYWVVGVSGVIEGMIIIGLCCLCTFLTAISLAASKRTSSLVRIVHLALRMNSCHQWNRSSRWFLFPHIKIVGTSGGRCCRVSVLHRQCTSRWPVRPRSE